MRKTAQAKKQELVADLLEARSALLAAAATLSREDREVPFLGEWSACDIVAHLIGWDAANLEAIRAIVQGHLPAFYANYDTDWRTFNAGLVVQYKRSTLDETVTAAQASHLNLMDVLDALPAEDVIRDHGVRSPRRRKVTVVMLLSVEARDERVHCEQIRAFATQSHVGA